MKIFEKLTLDKAAYYALFGGVVIGISGKEYHNARFDMEISVEGFAQMQKQPLVNYVEYMNKRKKLKAKEKKVFGIALGINKQNYNKSYARARRSYQ